MPIKIGDTLIVTTSSIPAGFGYKETTVEAKVTNIKYIGDKKLVRVEFIENPEDAEIGGCFP